MRQLLTPEALSAELSEVASAPVVLDDPCVLAGSRWLVEADDLHRIARKGLENLLAAIGVQRSDPPPGIAGDDRVSDPQRAALDEHRRDRAAADVEARLDDRPRGLGLGIRRQHELCVRDEQHLLEQVVEVLLLSGGNVRELGRSTPLLGLEILVHELLADPRRVGAFLVDLVHRDDDRHLGRAGMGDRLLGLRLDAVIGCDDEHGDVRHLRAAGAHRRERFVAGRVQERDLAAVVLRLVGPDVLGDSTGFGLDDGRFANRIEERRLAVVDVPHDRHHRRPRDEVFLGVLVDLRDLVLLGDVLDRHVALDLDGDQRDGLVGEGLRDRRHRAEAHQDLDDLGRGNTERLREILDRDARADGDGTGRLGPRRRLRTGFRAVAGLSRVLPAAVRAGIDDDAPLATAGGLTRPDRSFRAVISLGISHFSPY